MRAKPSALQHLEQDITVCRQCSRLVAHRERIAREKRRAFRDWDYWGKPVPGFGDANAELLVVGLAPAAHGANRTGRCFTGDLSGDWLYRAMHEAGFANQPTSKHLNDGLVLRNAFVMAAVRCAPPENKPSKDEFLRCAPFLDREWQILRHTRVIVTLGKLAFDSALGHFHRRGIPLPRPKPKFSHGGEYSIPPVVLISSYHPSQRNTQTGLLTWEMWFGIFSRAATILAMVNEP